jgi:hypothetical protein
MDAVAAAITVDVIGLAAFNRDLQATCTLPSNTPTSNGITTHSQEQQQLQQQAAASGNSTTSNTSSTGGSSSKVQDGVGGSGAGGICGSVSFPRGREVLEVISHLVVAMQARNNPLNRWFPWRQVRLQLRRVKGVRGRGRGLETMRQQAGPARRARREEVFNGAGGSGIMISQ